MNDYIILNKEQVVKLIKHLTDSLGYMNDKSELTIYAPKKVGTSEVFTHVY